mmetsp:Transcript_13599/g.15482  ORF Transcript_13599/g.15482 Transcript_13599/m.15482 type:complete len:132 (-) Transcript_13599:1106-1501(-)
MGKLRQTNVEPGKGNALQVAVATLLGLEDLEKIPNFIEAKEGYLSSIQNYLQPLGKTFLKVDLHDGRLKYQCFGKPKCILAGKSPRGSHKHCVVGMLKDDGTSFMLSHDPHPSDAGLEDHQWAGFILELMQ